MLKGNVIIGQSGGPTAAINATLAGIIKGFSHKGRVKIYGMKNGIQGLLAGNIVDITSLASDTEKLSILESTPAAALGSCRLKLPPVSEDKKIYEDVISMLKKYNIGYFFYIGGNDSMDTVDKLSAYASQRGCDISVIGVPKTIDNDLTGTDHTPGYGSAAKFVATTVHEIIRDCLVYEVKSVTIVEIMGRNAGWLTAAAALGRFTTGLEPQLIYLPEHVFDADMFIEDLKSALERQNNIVVAVSEGIRYANGKFVCEGDGTCTDVFGHKLLSGAGKELENMVRERLGCKVRSLELNVLQRAASHLASKTDIDESVGVGMAAAAAALAGETGKMLTISRISTKPYKVEFETVAISEVANDVRFVPDEYISKRGNTVTDECVEYLLPLIEGEHYCTYKNGLPVHFEI